MRLVWLTDRHLNFVDPHRLLEFFGKVPSASPDALVITGDIGEASNVTEYLLKLDDVIQLTQVLRLALWNHEQVFLATHVPPFRWACWHNGLISDDEWAPHFTCQATGNVIRDIMMEYPDRQLTVLCGHTHGFGECHPYPNVPVITGGAENGFPRINQVFEILCEPGPIC